MQVGRVVAAEFREHLSCLDVDAPVLESQWKPAAGYEGLDHLK